MNKSVNAILAILAVIGIGAALGKVFLWGESLVNYGSYVPWGLWVGFYIFFVGSVSGLVWFGTWMGLRANSPQLLKLALATGAICLIGGIVFITLDIGKPFKAIYFFLSPNFSSGLVYAVWSYVLFLGCVALYLFKGNDDVKSPFVWGALAFSVVFILAESIFFSTMIARPLWNSAMTILTFLTSAAVGGGALFYGVASLFAKDALRQHQAALNRTLLVALVAHVIAEGVHLAAAMGHAQADVAVKGQLMDPLFWIFAVALGVLVPVFLWAKNSEAAGTIGAWSAFVGMAVYKQLFVKGGFATAAFPSLPNAFQDARLSLDYAPSLLEWIIAAGLIGAIALGISLAAPMAVSGNWNFGKFNTKA